ncbi:MAG: ATP-binding protein [Sulfuritalea sp.]|nr:ATP-binding protein [Sulfuritalea sp.]
MANLATLSITIEPLSLHDRVADINEMFLDERFERLLSLPVVDQGLPVGIISRNRMQRIFSSRFGREIQGKKPIQAFMNPAPLMISIDQSMETASHYVTRNISYPITEDFILVKDNRYHSVGSVIDLLRGMEGRLLAQNQSLASTLNALRESQAQLVQSEKMASLGQMVAGVAHEINTPLGYVRSNIEISRDACGDLHKLANAYDALIALLQCGTAGEDEIGTQFSFVQQTREDMLSKFPREEMDGLFVDTLYGLDQISEIVVNLKNFSRLDLAAEDQVDINQCINSALLIANNVVKHKAEVVREFGDLPKIRCAPSQINQVVLNLVTNAAHAIESNGRIHVRTRAAGAHVHMVITDNGKGIAAEHLKKIFDPFFTTKPIGEGTGLGLSIVFKIIKDHGGHIRVKSVPGAGTAFCVSLPIHPQQQSGSLQ